MKRSLSFEKITIPVVYKRAYTWNEGVDKRVSDSLIALRKRAEFEGGFFGTPVCQYGKKGDSKIRTSDFWPNSMKLKIRKMSEKRFEKGFKREEEVKLPVLDKRYSRSNTDKEWKERKTMGLMKVKSLEEIIDDCNLAFDRNKKINKDIKRIKESMEREFRMIRKIVE